MPDRENKKARTACIVSEQFDKFLALLPHCEDPQNAPGNMVDELFAYLDEKLAEISSCHAELLQLDQKIHDMVATYEETETLELATVLHCVLHIELYLTAKSSVSLAKATRLMEYIANAEYPLKSTPSFKSNYIATLAQHQSNIMQKEHQNLYSMTFAERQKYLCNDPAPLAAQAKEIQDRIRAARATRVPYNADLPQLFSAFTQNFALARQLEKNSLNANYSVLVDNNDYIFELIMGQLRVTYNASHKAADLLDNVAQIEANDCDARKAFAFFATKILKPYQSERLITQVIDYIALRAAIAYEKFNIRVGRPKLTTKNPATFFAIARQQTEEVAETMTDVLQAVDDGIAQTPPNPETQRQNAQILKFRDRLTLAMRRFNELYKATPDPKISQLYRTLVQAWLTFSSQAMRLSAQQGSGQLQDEEASHEYLRDVIEHFIVINKACNAVAHNYRSEFSELDHCMQSILLNMLRHLQRKYYARITNTDTVLQIRETLSKLRTHLHDRELRVYLQVEQELESAYIDLLINNGRTSAEDQGAKRLATWYQDMVATYDSHIRGAKVSDTESLKPQQKIESIQVMAQRNSDNNRFMHHYATLLQNAETLVPRRKLAAKIEQPTPRNNVGMQ